MKSLRLPQERGQALVVVALAAIVLFGFTALAIDGSAKFSDRRHAQNAADAAALAGALAFVNDDSAWDGVARARADDNGYTGDLINDQVWVFQCNDPDRLDPNMPPVDPPLNCGAYEGKEDYIEVIILSHVNTTFARVFGFDQFHNLVQAVTLTKKGGPLFDGASIISLNPDTSSGCSGTLRFGGGSTITLTGGGMFVNSDESDCAMEQQGGCGGETELLVINGGGILSAGNGNVDIDGCTTNVPSVTYDQAQYTIPDDIFLPDEPIECDGSHSGSYYHTSGNTTHLRPGKYSQFPPGAARRNIILDAGVYCINGDVGWNNGSFDTLTNTGDGVTLYFTSGHDFTINGGNITLDASNSGDYAGYLFIVDTNFSGTRGDCTINGNSTNSFSGTIFAPYCDVSLSGTGASGTPMGYSTQVIGWNVQITGNSEVNFVYDPGDNAENKRKVGLMK